MRMLDEVIAYFDNQTQQRHVYLTEDAEDIYNDVLHFLKEYQKEIGTMYEAVERMTKEEHRLAENEPLTWDELKQMEGKPVWVEALLYKQWAVIAYIGEEYIRFEGANLYAPECRIYMGEDNGWQAYRKERS